MLCILKVIKLYFEKGMLYADFSIRRWWSRRIFGGRLVEKGEDVTFLVRSKRKTIRGKRTCNPKC